MERAVTKATWKGRESVWREWRDFCSRLGVDSLRGEVVPALLCFVGEAFEKGVSASGLLKKLAGLAYWFKLFGVRDATKDFVVRQAVLGYSKSRVARDSRRPVSFDLLVKLVGVLGLICSDKYEEVLFSAAFALAFFGAFRVGELVSHSCVASGGLQFGDVSVGVDCVSCFLRRSKTDQSGKGKRIVLYAVPGAAACPVRCVQQFLAIRPCLQPGGSFLVHRDGRALSRFQFIAIFRSGLDKLGLPAREFASHSFRIGAATEAVRWGLGEQMVRQIGRWESERFRSYVRLELL
ncbi:integrase/recombinase xerD homolog [Dendropsophus ebraccatus]|uniref:integrase/recombinase xerD homolog n=1 Tax=Dendropsophus ebraccatus TaxID=150705 RepID=UPI003831B50C